MFDLLLKTHSSVSASLHLPCLVWCNVSLWGPCQTVWGQDCGVARCCGGSAGSKTQPPAGKRRGASPHHPQPSKRAILRTQPSHVTNNDLLVLQKCLFVPPGTTIWPRLGVRRAPPQNRIRTKEFRRGWATPKCGKDVLRTRTWRIWNIDAHVYRWLGLKLIYCW